MRYQLCLAYFISSYCLVCKGHFYICFTFPHLHLFHSLLLVYSVLFVDCIMAPSCQMLYIDLNWWMKVILCGSSYLYPTHFSLKQSKLPSRPLIMKFSWSEWTLKFMSFIQGWNIEFLCLDLQVAMKLVPDRKKFYELLGGGNLNTDIETFVTTFAPILQENHNFLVRRYSIPPWKLWIVNLTGIELAMIWAYIDGSHDLHDSMCFVLICSMNWRLVLAYYVSVILDVQKSVGMDDLKAS